MIVDEATAKESEKKELIPYSFAKRHGVLIHGMNQSFLKIVHRADCNPSILLELRRFLNVPLYFEAVETEKFTSLLTTKYEVKSAEVLEAAENISETMNLQQIMGSIPDASDLLEQENEAPVILLINTLLREAIKKFSSDIHFETYEKTLVVRFRIDGILHPVLEVPFQLAPLVMSRIKVMAKLNISEKRLPQDGRFTVNIAGKTIDIRVSAVAVSHGERLVLRLLNKNAIPLSLTHLGMNEILLNVMKRLLVKAHGIILVTGPTGAGKTTTLYAMLMDLNLPGRNIMTVEDPAEYDLPGIGQIQVNRKIDMTFAKGLRAILRQDPDIIMVGEIRDLETAVIATQASLTGHLVLSTLHTNTAIGAITRLGDMGVESFLLASSIVGIIAQRLIRLLCTHCKEPYVPTQQECQLLDIPFETPPTLYKARSCAQCNNAGYSHRIGIYEVIEIDAELRNMIHDNVGEQQLTSYARTKFASIQYNGYQQVVEGKTSLEEVMRVTNE